MTDDVSAREVDMVIVGAGFAGLYALYRARAAGISAVVIEAGDGVGGTWYWNRYPGARCDIESLDYSYSFSDELQQEWTWSERYASQPEILRYLNHVADRFGLRDGIVLATRVVAAHYDESTATWAVATDRAGGFTARWCVFATGCLSDAQLPRIDGIDSFSGSTYHTGRWPAEELDFGGQRVAVIGTGSSGIQVIPAVASRAREVIVFQRTPNYCLPAYNRPLSDEQVAQAKLGYRERRRLARRSPTGVFVPGSSRAAIETPADERHRIYEQAWSTGGTVAFNSTFHDLRSSLDANETAAEFVRAKIREIVDDPATAEQLSPRDHHFAARRLCLGADYYFPTFNRPNVRLVDVSATGIDAIEPTGIRVGDELHEVDSIVFATGFDAFTGAVMRVDIRGVGGRRLRDAWADGPATYLGLMSAGFPNLFTITGPGSPSVLSNVVVSIEQHVELLFELLDHAMANDAGSIDVEPAAQAEWCAHVDEVGRASLLATTRSWYVTAGSDDRPARVLPYAGGVGFFREICEYVAATGFPGFRLGTVATVRSEPAEMS